MKKTLSSVFSLFSLTFVFCLLSFVLITCSNPSSSDNKVTFSGTITLEGQNDNSGVTVSLYKPVELDTAITHARDAHTGLGVALSQRTEFFWRVEKAVYSTTTKSDGSWDIKAEAGSYNIVVAKDGYGWRAVYEQSNSANINITLPKPLTLKGAYFEALTIPDNSFVIIDGKVAFNFVELQVGAGSIMEFRNNGKLEMTGPLNLNGNSGNEILLTPQDTSGNAEISIHDVSNGTVDYVAASYIKNGFYIKNMESFTFTHNRIAHSKTVLEMFGSPNTTFSNNIISSSDIGLNISTSSASIQKNIFFHISGSGIEYYDNPGSVVTKNVFKRCGNGFTINRPGGFYTSDSQLDLTYNDFILNENHISMGYKVRGGAHNNNFFKSNAYTVKCGSRFIADTLDFKANYWSTNSNVEISQQILDAADFDTGSAFYPLIDFMPFASTRIIW